MSYIDILNILESELKMSSDKIFNIYLYGSRVYGVANDKSDYDYIIVSDTPVNEVEYRFKDGNNIEYNFHVLSVDYFQKRLDLNEPEIIECLLWSKKQPILETKEFVIKIDFSKYRHSVSHISSNSYVKAKKKIEVEDECYIGQKSLYHSLRIPMYAIQVLKYNDIVDWQCANEYWDDIMKLSTWEELKAKYKPIHNYIMSEFRKLCPKSLDN